MNNIKLVDNMNDDTVKYFNALSVRTTAQSNMVKLLKTNFKDAKKNHILLAGLDKQLTARFIHSAIQQDVGTWILNMLKGVKSDYPVDIATGLHSHPVVVYFRLHTDLILESCKPIPKTKAVDEPTPTMQTLPDMVTDTDAEPAPIQSTLDYVFEQWLTLSESEQGDFAKMVTAHKKATKQALANVI